MLYPFFLTQGGSRSAAAAEEEFQMAFPWLFEENFELGVKGAFTGTTVDTLGKISFPGPLDDQAVPPARGGGLMQVDLDRGVADAYLVGDTSLNIATGVTAHGLIRFRIGDETKLPLAANEVTIFRIGSGTLGATLEASIVLCRADTGELQIAVRNPDIGGGTLIRGIEAPRNEWMDLELTMIASSAGVAQFRVKYGKSEVAAIGMTWATLTGFWLGAMGQSLEVRGALYFDTVIFDEDRLVAPRRIDPLALSGETLSITKSGFVFVGPGEVKCTTIISMGTDHEVRLYDIDSPPFSQQDLKLAVRASTAETRDSYEEKFFHRGCWAQLAGTTPAPSAVVKLGEVEAYSWGEV